MSLKNILKVDVLFYHTHPKDSLERENKPLQFLNNGISVTLTNVGRAHCDEYGIELLIISCFLRLCILNQALTNHIQFLS